MNLESKINEIIILCNNNNIELNKYIINDNNIIINFSNFKIITDFNTYCYATLYDKYSYLKKETNNCILNLDLLNNYFAISDKLPLNIINEIKKELNKEIKEEIKINEDPYNIFYEIKLYNKNNINYEELYDIFIKFYKTFKLYNNKIPNSLLLSSNQICSLIINEIKKVNTNKEYEHYIEINNNNPYSLLVKMFFTDNKNPIIIEFLLIINPETYPYTPPQFEFIKPAIKDELYFSLLNLNIFQLSNWSYIISIDYIISNLSNLLKPIIYEYLIKDNNENILNTSILNLAYLLKDNSFKKINLFDINIPKKELISEINYWNSGIGYSNHNNIQWDINQYINEQEIYNEKIIKYLNIIYNYYNEIKDKNINIIIINYICNQLNSINILEIQNNQKLYKIIFTIFEYVYINNIDLIKYSDNLINLNYELENIININDNIFFNNIYLIINNYIKKINLNNIKIESNNNSDEYCTIMKDLQFNNNYIILESHKFFNKKNIKLETNTIMRILSEISSLKKVLPLYWDTTIWCRISKENYNIFTFLISGPKNTPYENGLFEFHIYLPSTYPNEVPQVLLNNTNNFRFNPNLYESGKVCLSLLGTWNGNASEKWNPKTSTILQIMISIQSLILIEEPYFNEPGYEKNIGIPEGINKSKEYNNKIYPNTVKILMINMINNPPIGFEDIVSNHFKLKKNEILETVKKWNIDLELYNNLNLILLNNK
jgi:ubiquitin-protein ligase